MLVLKNGGRRTALAELPVQKNKEPVFIAKFWKESIEMNPQKHKDEFLVCSMTLTTSDSRALGLL